jgi:KUP system potassium uptake protein
MSDSVPSRKRAFLGVALAALGVVYGDIGTSPLYAFRACFVGACGLEATAPNVLGVASLIFWFLTAIVAVKYVAIVLRADNEGEGGVLALVALVRRFGPRRIRQLAAISVTGAVGAALLFSDGIITPAISVLSAVEGLAVLTPALSRTVIPLALFILASLFAMQSRGTSRIGALFGPVLLVWFGVIAALGLWAIAREPAALRALNPCYAIHLLGDVGWRGLGLLATAFLAVTGAEVLFADMGHFGRAPIRATWFALVYPALAINYLGQGACLMREGVLPENLFYRLAPGWFLLPLILIATTATIIASQAVISGMFSLAKQAVQLGFWPRLHIVHTSEHNPGEVYLPFINLTLFVCVSGLVVHFKHSSQLASAYGIAVSATMLVTTMLLLLLAGSLWRSRALLLMPVLGGFLLLDSAIFIGNVGKLVTGGWIVVLLTGLIVLLMMSWVAGRARLRRKVESEALPLEMFSAELAAQQPVRTHGTAIFLSGNPTIVPRALLHNFKHNRTLHERIIILAVLSEEIPAVPAERRVTVADAGSGITRIAIRFGFTETPDVPAVLRTLTVGGAPIDPLQVSFFLGKESLVLGHGKRGWSLPRRVFEFLSKNAASASSFYCLPPNRVVEFGQQVEI